MGRSHSQQATAKIHESPHSTANWGNTEWRLGIHTTAQCSPMEGALHAVEGRIWLLRHPPSNVCQPAVDEGVGTGGHQGLAPMRDGAHGLQHGQQGGVLVHGLG